MASSKAVKMDVPWRHTSYQSLIAGLSFDQLFAFQAVVRAGSFRAAASVLVLSQPAVSQRMRYLEQLLGCALFERNPGTRATLTPAGQELLAFADEIMPRINRFHRLVETMKQRSEGSTLTVVSGSNHIQQILVKAVSDLKARDSTIQVVVRQEHTADRMVSELLSGRADIGICRAPAPPGVKKYGYIQEELHLFAVPDHPILSCSEDRRLDELALTGFASFAEGMRTRELIDRWADKLGVSLRTVLESRTLDAMRAYVSSGLAVSILPQSAVLEELDSGQVVPVPIPGLPLTRTAVILVRPQRSASYEIRAFIDALPTVSSGPAKGGSSKATTKQGPVTVRGNATAARSGDLHPGGARSTVASS